MLKKKLLIGGLIIASLIPTATPAFAASQPTTKTITIENKKVAVPVKGVKWIDVNGHWHFVENGTMVTGWKQLGPAQGEKTVHYSYFDKKTGRLYKDWQYMDAGEGEKTPHWSYFGDNGWMRTGWVEFGKGTANPDGNSARHWSYFGDNGWMRTNWVQFGKGTANPDGNVAKHWSYFGNNGWLRTGLQTMGNAQNPDSGKYQHLSYFGGNGWLVENKDFSTGGKNYYANGAGWVMDILGKQIDGSLYSINGRKTVIIGDSRAVEAYTLKTGEKLPVDKKGFRYAESKTTGKEVWFAHWAQGITWYKTIENTVYNVVKKEPKNTDVIWLLGVNDCTWRAEPQYVSALKKLKSTGANVYYVTINKTNNYKDYEKLIPIFNNNMKAQLNGTGIKIIDSYKNVNLSGCFPSGDKLHYNREGTNRIMKYVFNAS